MKVLVFGSNGLVGNSLRRKFSNSEEYECLFSTREDTNLFSFQDTKKTISRFNPDLIINAAAKVGGIYANDTQGTSFLIENLKININILESIINLPKVSLINLGSSCIYPLNAPNPINENSFMGGILEPTNSPYAMAKLTAIELGKTLKKDYGHNIINLMPTNLYGPRDNYDPENSHVLPALIRKIHEAKEANDQTVTIWGTGTPKREFLYSDNLSNALLHLMHLDDDKFGLLVEPSSCPTINIGSGIDFKIIELADKIKKVIGFEGDFAFDISKPDGTPRKLMDSTKINQLGWRPKVCLDEGIKMAYLDYLNQS